MTTTLHLWFFRLLTSQFYLYQAHQLAQLLMLVALIATT